jgi:hypothetical protein
MAGPSAGWSRRRRALQHPDLKADAPRGPGFVLAENRTVKLGPSRRSVLERLPAVEVLAAEDNHICSFCVEVPDPGKLAGVGDALIGQPAGGAVVRHHQRVL